MDIPEAEKSKVSDAEILLMEVPMSG